MNVFNAVCFCVLMDHHRDGVEQAHPEYVAEKLAEFKNCSESQAFSMLDRPNQGRVLRWCEVWGIDKPIV